MTRTTRTAGQYGGNSNPLVRAMLDGLNVKSRADGTVHSVHGPDGKTTVAEVCDGKSKTRLNFRQTPTAAQRGTVKLEGRSKSWPGGGIVVTAANVAACRKLLAAVATGKSTKPRKQAAPKVEAAPVEAAPVEAAPVEAAPVEAAPVEVEAAPII